MTSYLLMLAGSLISSPGPIEQVSVEGTIFVGMAPLSNEQEEIKSWLLTEPLDESHLEKFRLEFVVHGNVQFVWDSRLYSAKAMQQRLDIWERLSNGKLKVNDTVDFGDCYEAVSGYHSMLFNEFGLTAENAKGVMAGVSLSRTITIEARDGSRKKVSVQQSNLVDLPNLKPIKAFEKTPSSNSNRGPDQIVSTGSEVSVQYFGFRKNPTNRFLATQWLFGYWYEEQTKAFEQLNRAVDSFQAYLSTNDPSLANGSLQLSENDKSQIAFQLSPDGSELGKWDNYKVVDSETTPFLGIRFLDGQNGNLIFDKMPVMLLDKPTRPSKIIRPL